MVFTFLRVTKSKLVQSREFMFVDGQCLQWAEYLLQQKSLDASNMQLAMAGNA